MASTLKGRAFIVMPFGKKKAADGTEIDFDRVYAEYLEPVAQAAGLFPFRADAERRGGSIHADMFQELLMAELVIADLTIDNPNVWYEVGVRHALRASGVVLTYAQRDRLPFDLAGQRMLRYTLQDGVPAPGTLVSERATLQDAVTATLDAWLGRKASPVYAQMPNLQEPDWKTLKVGDVNEVWQALERWMSRVEVARQKQRPGDIIVLADETPNRALEFEALRTAAKALLDLLRPRFALAVLERARALNPDDVLCRQMQAIALGRLGMFEEARETLRQLAEARRDGETLGLLARTWKDEWTRLWEGHPSYAADPRAAARDTAATLAKAAQAYVTAFRANPAASYPGINGLMLGRIWEHVTQRNSKLGLDLVATGVRWAADCAVAKGDGYWPLVTRAEQALLDGARDMALDDYAEAAALAVSDRKRFDLNSSRQTLTMLVSLGLQSALATEAMAVLDGAARQLDTLTTQATEPGRVDPSRVVLFSGHMVDKVDRGVPRFPEAKAAAAAARIAHELDLLGAGPGDLGIAQAASGGDLLFTQACLDRGMRLEIHLPQREPEFLAASVSFAAPHWMANYDALRSRKGVLFRIMPDELGPTPEGVGIYDRCNRWMLNAALSNGLAKVAFLALWDGKAGDGVGGTEDVVALVLRLTGRQPVIIDPASL